MEKTDTHQHLHANYCHRTHRSILYSQAIRMKRICSNEEELNDRLMDLESWLVKRRYQKSDVHQQIQIVHELSRDELLIKRRSKLKIN